MTRPVRRRISRRPPAEKKIRLSRRFCRRLSRDHNDLHGVKVVIIGPFRHRKKFNRFDMGVKSTPIFFRQLLRRMKR